MQRKVMINDYVIDATQFQLIQSEPYKISFVFTVTHDDYHEVTTLLYENDFAVKVPEEKIAFQATISNYATSITNLYEAGTTGEFTLELVAKDS